MHEIEGATDGGGDGGKALRAVEGEEEDEDEEEDEESRTRMLWLRTRTWER